MDPVSISIELQREQQFTSMENVAVKNSLIFKNLENRWKICIEGGESIFEKWAAFVYCFLYNIFLSIAEKNF